MRHGMGELRLRRFALLASLAALGACSTAQLALSERQTGAILTDLDARVAAEREAARLAAEAKPQPKEAPAPEVPPVLALDDALKIAGRQNRDLATSREGLTLSALALLDAENAVGPRLAGAVSSLLVGDDRAEEIRTNAGTLSVTSLLPTGATATVEGEASHRHGLGDEASTSAGSSVTATIRQPLLRGAGYEASHEILTDAKRQALYDVRAFELTRQDLALDVQSDFYGIVTQKQVIRNRELSLASFEFLKRRTDRLFELGRASEVDKFRAAREYLTAENDLVDARQELDSRLDRLKIRLGLSTSVTIDVAEEIPTRKPIELDLRRAVDVALLNRLDLMTARDTVEDSERRLRIRERDLLPDLGVEAVGRRASDPDSRRVSSPLERDSWSLGVSLELPLDRVRERNALRAARIELDRSRRGLSLLEDSVILDVRDALRTVRSAELSFSIQEQIAASEEKNVRIANIRFQNGEIGNRDLTDALTSLADARDRLVREKANVETARTRLLRALGILYLDAEGTWRE
jgi:outer membrane protein TolC